MFVSASVAYLWIGIHETLVCGRVCGQALKFCWLQNNKSSSHHNALMSLYWSCIILHFDSVAYQKCDLADSIWTEQLANRVRSRQREGETGRQWDRWEREGERDRGEREGERDRGEREGEGEREIERGRELRSASTIVSPLPFSHSCCQFKRVTLTSDWCPAPSPHYNSNPWYTAAGSTRQPQRFKAKRDLIL